MGRHPIKNLQCRQGTDPFGDHYDSDGDECCDDCNYGDPSAPSSPADDVDAPSDEETIVSPPKTGSEHGSLWLALTGALSALALSVLCGKKRFSK